MTRARAIVPNAIARDDVAFAYAGRGESMGITKAAVAPSRASNGS